MKLRGGLRAAGRSVCRREGTGEEEEEEEEEKEERSGRRRGEWRAAAGEAEEPAERRGRVDGCPGTVRAEKFGDPLRYRYAAPCTGTRCARGLGRRRKLCYNCALLRSEG